jgi:hypothetical protein
MAVSPGGAREDASAAAWFYSLMGVVVRGRAWPSSGTFDVRAIPPEPQIIHSSAGDGPGRAVFRRGVPQRSGV